MKTYFLQTRLLLLFLFTSTALWGQETDSTVTDFDGNIYHTVVIGDQVWLKENLKSLHYADGSEIPDVAFYNKSGEMAEIYGLLYTWDAAMKDARIEGTQGICPDGWHIPSDAEWKQLDDHLGGAAIAGGKMKEAGLAHWKYPNTGADNSSGLAVLPGGEYDAYYTPNKFNLLTEYAVFWTSTEISSSKARERYLSYSDAKCSTYDWYKVMKYSIRCVKDSSTTGLLPRSGLIPSKMHLKQNYPNPFNPTTVIEYFLPHTSDVQLSIYNTLGQKLATLYEGKQSSGTHYIDFRGQNLPSGIYIYELTSEGYKLRKRCLLLK